ncbi:MAG: hypothetical protein ACRDUV_19200, partial [Pseudonocardiaceae bacterium]
MRLLHSAANTSARFDDPNLVSCAGLVTVIRLAQRCDLAGLVGEHVAVTVAVGANARLKVPAIVAGMIAGADSHRRPRRVAPRWHDRAVRWGSRPLD